MVSRRVTRGENLGTAGRVHVAGPNRDILFLFGAHYPLQNALLYRVHFVALRAAHFDAV